MKKAGNLLAQPPFPSDVPIVFGQTESEYRLQKQVEAGAMLTFGKQEVFIEDKLIFV